MKVADIEVGLKHYLEKEKVKVQSNIGFFQKALVE
jgi:hypothetical protein